MLALGAALGALHPNRSLFVAGMVVTLIAAAWRSVGLLGVGLALLVSGLAQRSLDGLDELQPGSFAGEVELVGDPEPSFGGVRADVRLGGRRLEARAEGAAAVVLTDRLAGERVWVRGLVQSVPPESSWLVPRHVSGRLTVLRVESWRVGEVPSRVANGLRRTLVSGATSMSDRQRALFTGLVIGDDRAQPADLADDFLGAGLTHLLAVSGQNVAFALAMAGPVLRRLRLWPRLILTLGVIGLFGLMTRFEPSVLRASAMAALAALVVTAGHPTARVRVIALAVVALLVVDPLLVRSVGFRLSVAAASAIVLLAPRIERVLPGPRLFREALGVTLAAQLGVAPILLSAFGPIPVASLPANLLAVPVAGALMVWGLTGGLLAGVVSAPIASLLHVPSRLGLDWLGVVARQSAQASLGELGGRHVFALGLGLGLASAAHRLGSRARKAGLAVAVSAVVVATVAARVPPPLRASITAGVTVWRHDTAAVVVLSGAGGGRSVRSPAVLEGLRRSGVGAIGVLVVADASVTSAVVTDVARAYRIRLVVAAQPMRLGPLSVPVARPPPSKMLEVGDLVVEITAVPDRLVVDARPR